MRNRTLRRWSTALVAGLILVAGSALVPAQATSNFSFSRLAGANRYATAANVATTSFTTADNVVLATGEQFPDALAGNYLAGNQPGPILLTAPDQLSPEARSALSTLKAKKVFVLGGTNAVSDGVVAQLVSAGYAVERVAGGDRYDTAAAVAAKPGATAVGSVNGKKTALLASGVTFADALAGGPLAYRAKLPTFLTPPDTLAPQAKKGFQDLGIQRVIILGGSAAVSAAVEQQVQQSVTPTITTQRLQGADRTGTAVAIADFALNNLAFDNTHVNLARGDNAGKGVDALAGGPHAGKEGAPILLTASPTDLDTPAKANQGFLSGHKNTLTTGNIFGGNFAVSQAVEGNATVAAGANPPEAANGQSTPTVSLVDTAGDFFTATNNTTYYYDGGDQFAVKGITTTISGFEAALNPDDIVTTVYNQDAAGASNFNITNDVVHTPGQPGVVVTDADNDGARDDARVTISLPTNNSSGTTYELQRNQFQPAGTPLACQDGAPKSPSYTKVRDVTTSGTYVDASLSNGCYVYRVVATQPTTTGKDPITAEGADSSKVEAPGPTDSTAPTITSVKATKDTGTAGTVDAGDVHEFQFSETLASSADDNGSTYRISDGDGTVLDIVCGTNADCALTDAPPSQDNFPPKQYSILTVTLKGTLTPSAAGTTAGVQYPATLTQVNNNFRDEAGNQVTLSGSDTTVEAPA